MRLGRIGWQKRRKGKEGRVGTLHRKLCRATVNSDRSDAVPTPHTPALGRVSAPPHHIDSSSSSKKKRKKKKEQSSAPARLTHTHTQTHVKEKKKKNYRMKFSFFLNIQLASLQHFSAFYVNVLCAACLLLLLLVE